MSGVAIAGAHYATTYLATTYGLTDPDQINQFQHACTSALTTYYAGREVATAAGNAKEARGPQGTSGDTYRDQFNNEVGRQVGEQAVKDWRSPFALGKMVADAVKQGQTMSEAEGTFAKDLKPGDLGYRAPQYTPSSAPEDGSGFTSPSEGGYVSDAGGFYGDAQRMDPLGHCQLVGR